MGPLLIEGGWAKGIFKQKRFCCPVRSQIQKHIYYLYKKLHITKALKGKIRRESINQAEISPKNSNLLFRRSI